MPRKFLTSTAAEYTFFSGVHVQAGVDELQPTGQIQPVACLHIAYEYINGFYICKG